MAMRLKVRCPETHPGAVTAPGVITCHQGRAPGAVLQGMVDNGGLIGIARSIAALNRWMIDPLLFDQPATCASRVPVRRFIGFLLVAVTTVHPAIDTEWP
jgi:hypothetical protein